jgi:hypothetical protein
MQSNYWFFLYLVVSIILLFLLSIIIIDPGISNVMSIGFIVCIYAQAFYVFLIRYTGIVIYNPSQVFYYYVLIILNLS